MTLSAAQLPPVQLMNTPLISVIVPCFNQARFLRDCLDSVLAQTYPHWECIIINDGSTDDTRQVSLEYTSKDSRFRYVEQENRGLSGTRNRRSEEHTSELQSRLHLLC